MKKCKLFFKNNLYRLIFIAVFTVAIALSFILPVVLNKEHQKFTLRREERVRTQIIEEVLKEKGVKGTIKVLERKEETSKAVLSKYIVNLEGSNNTYYFYSVVTQGKVSNIETLVGIDAFDHSVIKVKVLKENETPEYYDKIRNNEDYFKAFNGKSIKLHESDFEFSTVSGATVSSEAIIKAIAVAQKEYSLDNISFTIPSPKPKLEITLKKQNLDTLDFEYTFKKADGTEVKVTTDHGYKIKTISSEADRKAVEALLKKRENGLFSYIDKVEDKTLTLIGYVEGFSDIQVTVEVDYDVKKITSVKFDLSNQSYQAEGASDETFENQIANEFVNNPQDTEISSVSHATKTRNGIEYVRKLVYEYLNK